MYWRKLLQTYLRRMCLVSIFRQFVETRNCAEKIIESQTFCENMMAALCKLQLDFRFRLGKGGGKRVHIVVDTLLLMMFLGLRKLGNICCGHKMFLNKIRNIFCVRNKCCARGQTGKHFCRQQCIRNNCPRLQGP